MFKFYADQLRQLPRLLFAATNAWSTLLVLVLAILLWLNAEWANVIEGLPPWVGLALIGLLLFYNWLRANYESIKDIREKAALLPSKEQEIELLREDRLNWQKRYNVSQAQYEVFRQFDKETKGIEHPPHPPLE